MIPKKLTIKGLYSYSEEATIDFEQLAQAHIFGIFGNVGSGKSAILEAMMLALYGEVPRLGHGKGDNRNYNMMNLNSNDLSVDFEFEAGGKKYRSIVEAKRNSKKFEEVSTPKARRFEWDLAEKAWHPRAFEPADVIGLKLEHFTKTIIVPQNQFQEFLQLKDTERAKMMSDLFNLERFDLSKKATALENKNKIKVSEVQIQLEQMGDVTKAQILELGAQLIDLEVLTNEDAINVKEKQQAETDAQQLKKQFDTLAQLKKRLVDFDNRTPQYNALEKQLTDYEYCQSNFSNLMSQREAAAQSVAKNAQSRHQKRTDFTANERFLAETKTLHKSLRPNFDNRHNRLREAEELSHILAMQQAEDTINNKTKRIEKGAEATTAKRLIIDTLKQERAAIDAERATLKSPNILELQSVKDWFTKSNGLIRETATLEQQVAKFTETLDSLLVSHQFLIVNTLPNYGENYPLSVTLSETILALKKGVEHRELAKEASNKKMQHALAVLELEKLATTLVEGAPCPLCGAVHHPETMNATDVQRVVATIQKEIADLNANIKTLQNIEKQVDTLFTNFRKTEQDRLLLTQQIVEKRRDIDAHAATFTWSDFSINDEAAVNVAFATADATVKRIEALNENGQIKNKKIEAETVDLKRYEDGVNGLKSDIAVANGQKQTLENQLHTLKWLDFVGVSEAVIAQKQLAIKAEVKALEIQFADVEKRVEKHAEIDAILRGSISELEQNKTQLNAQLSDVETALTRQLTASNFDNIEAIKVILNAQLNIELERKRLNDFRSESNAAQKTHDALNAELGTKQYSLDNHNLLINDIQDLTEKIEHQNRRIGGLKATIADLKGKLNRRNQLETERRVLDKRAENITKIKNLFRGNAFMSYASTFLLKNLCAAANERFERLTNNRLRLEITADNTFLVQDLLSDGKTRNVKTLSGGQTFQAALSLALALADNIQSLSRSPQNFFFLDEGFGSLDKDSLQIVFETLKSLRKENRIVGVISHVEEMQQEIERYVRVVLDEEKGSQLSYF